MSGQTTTWFRARKQELVFYGTPLPFNQFDVALTRRVPASNAAASQLDEPGPYGYARVTIALGAPNWALINGVEMGNRGEIYFPRASGPGWGTLHGWALLAHGTGMVAAVGTLTEPLRCVGGIRPFIGANGIVFGEHD